MTVSQSTAFLSDIVKFAIDALHQNHSDLSFAEIIERSNYIRDGLIHFGLSADDVDTLFAASAVVHGPLPHVHQPKAEDVTQCAFCGAGAADDIHYTGGPGTGKGPALKAMVGALFYGKTANIAPRLINPD
jgi:hypothetical protein